MVKGWSLSEIKSFLKKTGYKESIKREYILEVLFKEHLEALQIKNRILEKYNIVISTTTIYKQLAILQKTGIVKCINHKTNIYEINNGTKESKIICIECKKLIEVNALVMNDLVKTISSQKDFFILEYNLNLYGYCRECRDE